MLLAFFLEKKIIFFQFLVLRLLHNWRSLQARGRYEKDADFQALLTNETRLHYSFHWFRGFFTYLIERKGPLQC